MIAKAQAEDRAAEEHRYQRAIVEQWNQNYPVGWRVGVRLKDGSTREMVTCTLAELFEDRIPAIGLQGEEGLFPLEICTPKIPKELEILLEHHTAEKVRRAYENMRAGRDQHGLGWLWALVKHWQLRAEADVSEAEKQVFLGCAKQLRQRTEWIQEERLLHEKIAEAAPHFVRKDEGA